LELVSYNCFSSFSTKLFKNRFIFLCTGGLRFVFSFVKENIFGTASHVGEEMAQRFFYTYFHPGAPKRVKQ